MRTLAQIQGFKVEINEDLPEKMSSLKTLIKSVEFHKKVKV